MIMTNFNLPFISGYYVGTIIIVVITILFTVYHKQIVKALQPTANKLKE